MEEIVKRPYNLGARAEAAAATRARIREAAHRLVVSQGYAATSLKQIAAEAGVGERTLYDTFGTKLALFRHTLRVALLGDEGETGVFSRPETVRARTCPDPHEALRLHLANLAALMERAGDLFIVGLTASGGDPDLQQAYLGGSAGSHRIQVAFAQHLADLGALRDGITVREAADRLFLLGSAQTWWILRRERGWSARRYRAWLVETATQQIL